MDVMRYVGGHLSTQEKISDFLRYVVALNKKFNGKFGFWAAMDKSTHKFMGWFYFHPYKEDPENVKRIELGYRLKKQFWGQGYATEGSCALVEKGFNELGVKTVFACAMKTNLASQKVMRKVGLVFSHEFLYPRTKEESVEYSLDKTDWLRLSKREMSKRN